MTLLKKTTDTLARSRYRLTVFVLLSAASVFCVSLVAARVKYTDSLRYLSLVWNLFLAWIPFGFAYFAYTLPWKRVLLLYIVIPICAILWLLFFPNAPYILTDLKHLAKVSKDVPLWYDVIMLIWFSWTGLLLGIISLYFMHEIVRRAFGSAAGWIFVVVVSSLSSFGVYLGRFLRLSSWDVLQKPSEFAVCILGWVISPSLSLLAFTALYTIFHLFVYITLYAFGHLMQEQANTQLCRPRGNDRKLLFLFEAILSQK